MRLHPLQSLRTCGATPPIPLMRPHDAMHNTLQGQVYLFLYIIVISLLMWLKYKVNRVLVILLQGLWSLREV